MNTITAAGSIAQETNESLALRSSTISEQELESVRGEAAQRVAAAERKAPPPPAPRPYPLRKGGVVGVPAHLGA